MKLPDKIVFHENFQVLSRSEKAKIKDDHRDKLLYITRLIKEETPNLPPRKATARGLNTFLKLAGVNAVCIESQVNDIVGMSFFNPETSEEICFIGCKENLMNKLYDFYYDGYFKKIENH